MKYICMYVKFFRGRGGLRGKIGHHKIGACAEIGQNRIRGGWGVKKSQKTSDIIIYADAAFSRDISSILA